MRSRRIRTHRFVTHNHKVIILAFAFWTLLGLPAMTKADWESDANTRIEQIRKRDAQITIVDSNGAPVPGLTVQIDQVKHRFGFGTAIPYGLLSSNANYGNFVIDHFEWAVCENVMKWSENESTRDEWTFSQADYIANWCADNDIVLRGHTLVWETNQQTPSWVAGLPCATYPTPSEMLEEIDERINYTVGRYAGQIVSWDVDNEMLSGNMFDCLGEAGRAHFFQQANSIDPDCGFYMNEYSGNSFGGYDGDEYAARAQGLINLGAPVEGLGIQAHVASPFRPEDYYNDVLDELDDLGLPIIATEFDTDATNATQVAEDLENFYRICFSHPLVEGIIMWGCEQSSWRWDGIVNSSTWALNAAGQRYVALMNEWTTRDSNTSNTSGQVDFRGFHGTYKITLSAPGQDPEIHTGIELEPGETLAEFEIVTALGTPEPDYDPPTPDPMTWLTPPTATGSSTITMTANTASDPYGVEYSFDCLTTGGHDSGWQNSSTYQDTGLNPNTSYTYRVQARDKSPNQNTTGWSSSLSATTELPGTDIEILGAWATGTSHTKESGLNRTLVLIVHAEDNAVLNLSSVTYGGQTMTKVIDISVGTDYRAYAAAYILNEAGVAAATSGTIVPTWGTTPDTAAYASLFLQNVDQEDSVLVTATNSSTSGATVATSAMATGDGDMVILGATCGNSGTYAPNNGFSEGADQQMNSTATGTAGHKAATGVAETPSVTFTGTMNRQVILGFVVQAASIVDTPPAAPTGLTATDGNQTVSLDWNDNGEADLAGYNVYRSTTSGAGFTQLNGSLVTDSNYTDTSVSNDITYYYVVTAVDAGDNESVYSGEVSATPGYQTCPEVINAGLAMLSDLNGDCYVDCLDLGTVALFWLHSDCAAPDNCAKSDFEPDGDVDFADFSDFALQWLECNDPENPDCPPNW